MPNLTYYTTSGRTWLYFPDVQELYAHGVHDIHALGFEKTTRISNHVIVSSNTQVSLDTIKEIFPDWEVTEETV